MYIYIYEYIYAYIRIYMYVYIYIHTYLYVCIFNCTNVCIYICLSNGKYPLIQWMIARSSAMTSGKPPSHDCAVILNIILFFVCG